MDAILRENEDEFIEFPSQNTKYSASLSNQAKRLLNKEDQCEYYQCCLSIPQLLFLPISYQVPKSGNS